MTTAADYTAAQVYGAISAALKAEDMPAVAGLVRLLAVKDPTGAEAILQALDVMSPSCADDHLEQS